MLDIIFVKQLRALICKEETFYPPVLLYCTMIIQMITGYIGMHFEGKSDPFDTLLVNGMRTHFHNKIIASMIQCHLHMIEGFKNRRRGHRLLLQSLFSCQKPSCPLQCRLVSQIK